MNVTTLGITPAKSFSDIFERSKNQNSELFNAVSMAEDILGLIEGVKGGECGSVSDKKVPSGILDQLYDTVEVRQNAIMSLKDLLDQIRAKC